MKGKNRKPRIGQLKTTVRQLINPRGKVDRILKKTVLQERDNEEVDERGRNLYIYLSCLALNLCRSGRLVTVRLGGSLKKNHGFPTSIYLLKVNNRNTRIWYEICSKITIKTPEQRQWRRFGVFIVNFQHISHFAPLILFLTLHMYLPAGLEGL